MAPSRPPDRTRALRLGLWLLFAALVIAGGDLVLRACGTGPALLGYIRDYCPAPPDHSFAREVAEGQSLRRQVHVAELQVAEQPPCPAPNPTPTATPPAPAPAPAVEPAPPPEVPAAPERTPESKAMDERVEERGGKEGKLQFTLVWNTRDDLDLNVNCPGGRISSSSDERGPGICGDGIKDIDANRNLVENVSSTPVENVVWASEYPEGEYKIEVIEYKAQPRGGAGNTVPFTLRMRLGDEERECRGTVSQLPENQIVERHGSTKSGTAQVITWHSGEPLPSCDFEKETTYRNHGSK